MLPQDLLRLLKLSAKKSFDDLRKKGPFFCEEIKDEVHVSRMFYNHVSYEKNRGIKELIERLLLIPFIEDIICTEEKKNKKFFKISKNIEDKTFSVILQKRNERYYLLSCFINFAKKRTT